MNVLDAMNTLTAITLMILGALVYAGSSSLVRWMRNRWRARLRKPPGMLCFAGESGATGGSGFASDANIGFFVMKPISDHTTQELLGMISREQDLAHVRWIESKPAYVSAGEQGEYDMILRARAELDRRGVPYPKEKA